jgi:hypothetical protein
MSTPAQIFAGASRGRLDEGVVAGFEIEKRVERVVDQRVGEGVELEDRAVREN